MTQRDFFLAVLVVVNVGWTPTARAQGADPLRAWADRASRVDSLFVEGQIRQYRVDAARDAADPANWTVRDDVCRTVGFAIWLRRPDFRINLRVLAHGAVQETVDHYAWMDGKLTVHGGLNGPFEHQGASIHKASRYSSLRVEPYLTPLEYHFFDYGADDAPRELAKLPHQAEGDTAVIEISAKDGSAGRIEFDPVRQWVPRRMMLMIGEDVTTQVSWDLATLETADVEGLPIISKARIVLYNPVVNPRERVVYLWEAHTLRKVPITRGDLEIVIPRGTYVMDHTTNTEYTAGDPASVSTVDPAVLRAMAAAAQAQLLSPEIRARRATAMAWIVGGAIVATGLVVALGLRLRRQRPSRAKSQL